MTYEESDLERMAYEEVTGSTGWLSDLKLLAALAQAEAETGWLSDLERAALLDFLGVSTGWKSDLVRAARIEALGSDGDWAALNTAHLSAAVDGDLQLPAPASTGPSFALHNGLYGSTNNAPASYTVGLADGAECIGGMTLLITVISDATVVTPSGFTKQREHVNAMGHYVYTKVSVAGETSWTVSPGSSARGAWYAVEIEGLDGITATDKDSTTTGGATTVTAPAVTVATPPTLLFVSLGFSELGGVPVTVLPSWTNSFVPIGTAVQETTTGDTETGLTTAYLVATEAGDLGTAATWATSAQSSVILCAFPILEGAV